MADNRVWPLWRQGTGGGGLALAAITGGGTTHGIHSEVKIHLFQSIMLIS